MKPIVLATFDGTSYSGKDLIAERVSYLLNATAINVSLVYRAFAFHISQELKVDIDSSSPSLNISRTKEDISFLSSKFETFRFSFELKENKTIFKTNVTSDNKVLMTEPIGAIASKLVLIPEVVKQVINRIANHILEHEKIILIGQICGTIVAPKVLSKFFVEASEPAKLERFIELNPKVNSLDRSHIVKQIRRRDTMDEMRALYPCMTANDSTRIDFTSGTLADLASFLVPDIKATNEKLLEMNTQTNFSEKNSYENIASTNLMF